MSDPLNYKKSGFPQRTSRSQARAAGSKVPPLPAANGYCAEHGMVHMTGSCQSAADSADAAAGGGASKLPQPYVPFKLGGG